MSKNNPTICWKCACPRKDCEWMRENKPVRGWIAYEKIYKISNLSNRRIKSYIVVLCPKFKLLEQREHSNEIVNFLINHGGYSVRSAYRKSSALKQIDNIKTCLNEKSKGVYEK